MVQWEIFYSSAVSYKEKDAFHAYYNGDYHTIKQLAKNKKEVEVIKNDICSILENNGFHGRLNVFGELKRKTKYNFDWIEVYTFSSDISESLKAKVIRRLELLNDYYDFLSYQFNEYVRLSFYVKKDKEYSTFEGLDSALKSIKKNNLVPSIAVEKPIDYKSYPVVSYPDKSAEFPGGYELMKEFIKTNIRYPESAKRDSLEGPVYIDLIVEVDGSFSDVKVIRGISPELDNEALRIVNSMPKFNPAVLNKSVVRSQIRFSVRFKIEEQ